ncbi:MAG: lysine biosynthesis protein LysX [Crenarchaeota archaeon]|nr:lysine biosynthesis protein LysX [Thermoproteota archaeon]MDW8033615.1 lysine biosynthesis protein LysX [Nitrososphaerota archaeon]
MPLGIFYDQIRFEEKELFKTAENLSVPFKRLNIDEFFFTLNERGVEIRDIDVVLLRCVSYFKSLHFSSYLEGVGIKSVSSFKTLQTAGNKLFASMELIKKGVKTPKTVLSFSYQSALNSLSKIGYPAVLKPVVGSWGRLISLIGDKYSAEAILEDRQYMSPLYQIYYIQEYVEKPGRDIRVTVIGGEIVSAIYRISPPDQWKTNIALGGRSEKAEVNSELAEIVLRAVEAVGGEFVGVDVLESPREGYLVNEVNPTPEFRGSMEATGINIPEKVIKYLVSLMKR